MLPSSYENIERCKAWYAPARVERAAEIGVREGDYRALSDRYNEAVEELVHATPPPPRILERRQGTSADEATLRALLARGR